MSLVQIWKEVVISQVCSGSASLVASGAIVTFISLNGLSNPYRRIIFGLSISDILQSFGIIVGPWLNNSSVPQALWGIGNRQTCRFQGSVYLLGANAVPMYTLFLCIYYVCKLKGKMPDAQFAHRVETKMHAIIILASMSLVLAALFMDTINSGAFGNMCLTAAWPTGCRQKPEIFGECDARIADYSLFFLVYSHVILPIVCLGGIISCLTIIFWNVVISDRIFGNPNSRSNLRNSSNQNQHQNHHNHRENDDENDTSAGNASSGTASSAGNRTSNNLRVISRRYKKELVIQACGYIAIFLLTNIPGSVANIIYIMGIQPSKHWLRTTAILSPLAGIFNIILYSRLDVVSFNRKHPECSIIQAFWLFLQGAGEMPNDDQWNESMAWILCSCVCFRDPNSNARAPTIGCREAASNQNPPMNIDPKTEQPVILDDNVVVLEESSQDASSVLFPIPYANIEHQTDISGLRTMVQSGGPIITSSIPEASPGITGMEGTLTGTPTITPRNNENLDKDKAKEICDDGDIEACDGKIQDPLAGNVCTNSSNNHQDRGQQSTTTDNHTGTVQGGLTRMICISNDLSDFSNVQNPKSCDDADDADDAYESVIIHNYEDTGDIEGQKTKTEALQLNCNIQEKVTSPSLPDSAIGMTGMSQSFDDNNPAHRPTGDWDYVRNLELSEILVAKTTNRDISSNCSSLTGTYRQSSCNEDKAQTQGGGSDIWASTFERVKRWQPSE